MIPSRFHYDALVQLFQTPGYVVLLKEMIHEVRIVPLDGRPHLGPTIGQWRGDSRGRWEGLRLADIRIPRGTPIHEADLQFTAIRTPPGTEPTVLTLHAELAGDAVAFSEVTQNISVRKPTAASVNWSPEPWLVGMES